MTLTLLRRWKIHDTTYLEEGDFIWRMQWKPKTISLHKVAYPAPAGNQVTAGNPEAASDFKYLDLHNCTRYGKIAEAQNMWTADPSIGMTLRNQCAEIRSRGVDGLFLLDGVGFCGDSVSVAHGNAAGRFKANFGLEPDYNAHTNIKLPFSKRGFALES